MNIMLENGNLNNVVNFVLLIPETRNKDNEIFVSTFLKHLGFLAPETFYTNVKINGKFHKFIFQEKIRKEFLERNKLVEGPIFGGHENFYRYDDFERIARVQNTNWIKSGNSDRLELAFELLDFLNLLYLKDPKLNKNFKFHEFPFLEIDLDELYKNEIKRISEFDAMMYVLSGYHSLRGDNRRLYYHPILHEFYPIYYDGEVTILNKKVDDFFLDFENNEKRNEYERSHYPIPTYSTTVGISGIKKYLENVNIKELKRELKFRGLIVTEKKLEYVEERTYNEVIGEMLKDTGIKTKVIKQYLPVMNRLINQYLQVLDFFVAFHLDENFNETIRSRHRDAFNYSSFSEGEKQRIDLSLLFTWRQIAKMKNSAATNLLILDETFDSSLDHDGIDNLTKILNTLEDGTNVFIISHKGDILENKFRSKIEFVKDRNFSKIKAA